MKKGTNSADMKNNNKRLILNLIRQREVSRTEIARITGLTKATVSILVDELMREGIVSEEGFKERSGVGRVPLKLALCKNAIYVVGITMYRRYYYVGLYDLFGDAEELEHFEYEEGGSSETLKKMAKLTEKFKRKNKGANIIGIGIASPGPVNYKSGVILSPPGFDAWHGVGIAEELSVLTGLPVYLENIANAFAICQKYFGVCKAAEDYAYILVDDGIGAGIISDGRIYRGKSGNCSEFGHTSIKYDGRKCKCGNYGCLECYATVPAILEGSGYQGWNEAVDSGSAEILKMEAEYLSAALVNLVNLFDLEKIVIGGDIAYKGEKLASYIEEIVNQRKITPTYIKIEAEKKHMEKVPAAASIVLNELIF